MTRAYVIILALSACLGTVVSCSGSDGPDNSGSLTCFSQFGHDNGQKVTFTVDMSDTCVYALNLIARIDKKNPPDSVTIGIQIISPSGRQGKETVTYPSAYRAMASEATTDRRLRVASTSGYYDISWLYRDNIKPVENGEWTISIIRPQPQKSRIMGAGISLKTIPTARQQN